jgi:hypothetical protein
MNNLPYVYIYIYLYTHKLCIHICTSIYRHIHIFLPVHIAEAMNGAVYELHVTLGYRDKLDMSAAPVL